MLFFVVTFTVTFVLKQVVLDFVALRGMSYMVKMLSFSWVEEG